MIILVIINYVKASFLYIWGNDLSLFPPLLIKYSDLIIILVIIYYVNAALLYIWAY